MQRLQILGLFRKIGNTKWLPLADDVRMRCFYLLQCGGNFRIRLSPLMRKFTTAVNPLPVMEDEVKERREIDISDADERLYNHINVKVKGFDYAVLDSYTQFVMKAGRMLGISMSGKVNLPTRVQKFTVLKSPFVHKKHRVQYEMRIHSRLLQVRWSKVEMFDTKIKMD
ncbi:small ribosomal subunit protein uS10-like [Corticium candelabrum]|uniref:small ribosomal subunit protein uS10-like n=1 Tax=Corticium candelabrum TaxID=121492 RepID=UPI002E268C70|nr:small ribosomal subunit protein uS10-like [Corticium candelabrum]